jgi:uncharacterized membrane protein (DUF373 family)
LARQAAAPPHAKERLSLFYRCSKIPEVTTTSETISKTVIRHFRVFHGRLCFLINHCSKKEYNLLKKEEEMKHYFTIEKVPVFIDFFVTLALFITVKDMGSINSFSQLAVALLEFIIILELVRMLIGFVLSDDNRIKLRLMIDSTIVFFIRDIMLIVNDKFDLAKIVSILGIIAVLFVFRIVAMRYSPSSLENDYRKKS